MFSLEKSQISRVIEGVSVLDAYFVFLLFWKLAFNVFIYHFLLKRTAALDADAARSHHPCRKPQGVRL